MAPQANKNPNKSSIKSLYSIDVQKLHAVAGCTGWLLGFLLHVQGWQPLLWTWCKVGLHRLMVVVFCCCLHECNDFVVFLSLGWMAGQWQMLSRRAMQPHSLWSHMLHLMAIPDWGMHSPCSYYKVATNKKGNNNQLKLLLDWCKYIFKSPDKKLTRFSIYIELCSLIITFCWFSAKQCNIEC